MVCAIHVGQNTNLGLSPTSVTVMDHDAELVKLEKGKADEAVTLALVRQKKASEMLLFLNRTRDTEFELRGYEACRSNCCPSKPSLYNLPCLELAHQNNCRGIPLSRLWHGGSKDAMDVCRLCVEQILNSCVSQLHVAQQREGPSSIER
jgi:hypothetical protein